MGASADPAFESLLVHLRDERGFDFTGYKRASLERRVRRRMESLSIDSFVDYHDFLLVHQDEFTALFNTILINVTSFFRDPDAWKHLEENLLPELLRHREGQALRAWCAGCASGEEAYTLAMVLAEALGLDDFRDRVKIYATDVDEDALAHARHATYSAHDLDAVPEPLRDRYFEPTGSRFAFRKELRRSVIFGRNDIVQDAPISHVDILTCRNTLMYFNAETQAQVLNRMHFALRPDGVLFLGKAEMLLSHSSYFRAIELKRRFFRKVPTEPRDRRAILPPGVEDMSDGEDLDTTLLRHAALMQSPAAQIALDQEGRLAVCNNRAIHLFGLSQRDIGRPIQDLEMSYRPIELRNHIDEALHQRRALWVRDVTLLRSPGQELSIDLQLIPLSDDTGSPLGVTIIFNDVTQHRQLQNDLQYANRQLETAYEELQSTNEELETMNEELQSMNDELQFSNEALRDRQDELDRLNDFMTSVLGSMNSGVTVVDSNLKVLAWNARAEDLWGVRADEAVGSPLLDLDIGLPLETFRQAIREQLGSEPPEPSSTTVKAVNRRGRAIEVKVTLTHLDRQISSPAAMLVMDVLDED